MQCDGVTVGWVKFSRCLGNYSHYENICGGIITQKDSEMKDLLSMRRIRLEKNRTKGTISDGDSVIAKDVSMVIRTSINVIPTLTPALEMTTVEEIKDIRGTLKLPYDADMEQHISRLISEKRILKRITEDGRSAEIRFTDIAISHRSNNMFIKFSESLK